MVESTTNAKKADSKRDVASSVATTGSVAASYPAPTDEETSSLERLIKWFPLSTVLVVIIALMMGKSDHVTAWWDIIVSYVTEWWGMAASYLDITQAQLGALVVSVLVVGMSGSIAIRAILKQDKQSVVVNSEAHEEEKAALLRFFEATNGVGDGRTWKDRTNWATDQPLSKWKGVFLHPHTKRVYKLILPENGLSGHLPPATFTALTHLTELDLRDNQLTGPLPAEICSLPLLEGLYLYENRLTGDIPLGFANSPMKDKLTGLFLFNNRFGNVFEARKLFQESMRDDCYIYV